MDTATVQQIIEIFLYKAEINPSLQAYHARSCLTVHTELIMSLLAVLH
jgi:hypothetical protein